MEKLLKAFSSATRLEILDCIQQGLNSFDVIVEKMDKHRSTINNHLKILTDAGVIKKIQFINKQNQKLTTYALEKKANVLLATIKHLMK